MKTKSNIHFTLSFYEGEERQGYTIPRTFNSVKDASNWVNEQGLPESIFRLTEWDSSILDAYGVPEMLESMNLEEFIFERL